MTDLLATPNLGTAMLEHRDRIAFSDLRARRRGRVLAAMEREGLDACIFGREANVRYITGARRLWTAGSRPFAPSAAMVRATGAIHLLSHSASYEGMPEEMAPDDIFPLTWSPEKFVRLAAETPGLSDARRIGVDGMTPLFQSLLGQTVGRAELVPAEGMMRSLRRIKLPDEILCIRTAAAIAESAIFAAAEAIAPGVSEKALQAAYLERMCVLGTSQFAQQGAFAAIGSDGKPKAVTGDGTLDDGEAVTLSGGALWSGYEGSLARTWWCGRRGPDAAHREAWGRWREAADRLMRAARPGANGAMLRTAFEGSAAARAGGSFAVYSLGLGHEGFLAGGQLERATEKAERVAAGMVLAIRVFAPGGYLGEEMVSVGEDGNEMLTTLGHGPLAAR
ncbi:MAG TPA: aminopeptidase P family protein [Alphaproteobacteria bacterium]|nr:aminopeptidase P family protein [Alphaproteobacteria bacterium]